MSEYNYFHVQANGLVFGTNEPINSKEKKVNWNNTLDNTVIVLRNFPSFELAKESWQLSQSAKNA